MAITEAYLEGLQDLKGCDRHKILGLADLAKEQRDCASQVVTAVQQHLSTTNQKLPTLYVMDAIVKLIGEPYIDLFAQNLAQVIALLWESADAALKKDIKKLVGTWGPVFPASSVRPLEQLVSQLDASGGSPQAAPQSTSCPTAAATSRPQPARSVQPAQQPAPPTQVGSTELPKAFYSITIPAPAQPVPTPRPTLSAGPHQLQAQLNRSSALFGAARPTINLHTAPASAGVTQPVLPGLPLNQAAGPHIMVPPPAPPVGPRPLVGRLPAGPGFGVAALQQHGLSSYVPQQNVTPIAQAIGVAPIVGRPPTQGGSPSTYYPDPNIWLSTTQPAAVYGRLPPARPPSPVPQASHPQYRKAPSPAAPVVHGASSQDISLAVRNIAEVMQGSTGASSSRSVPFDIRSCVLDASKLKEYHEGVIDELLSMSSKTRPKHIDWSIVRRRRMKAHPVQSRQWFVTTENWLSGTTVTAESATPFFDVEMQKEDSAPVQEFSEPVDDSQRECAISGERFEEFYDPDTDGWRYKDARRLFGEEAALYNVPDGSIVKVICLSSSPAAELTASAASDQSDRSHLTEEACAEDAVLAPVSPGTKRMAEDMSLQTNGLGPESSPLAPATKKIRV